VDQGWATEKGARRIVTLDGAATMIQGEEEPGLDERQDPCALHKTVEKRVEFKNL
jgi:hypothetical protein